MAAAPPDISAEAPAPASLSRWVGDTARFDRRAHDRLHDLLQTFFDAGDRTSHRTMHLIWIGVDLIVTHLYPFGVANHIRGALDHGATVEEIIEIFEIASTVSDASLSTAFPIVFEEAEAAGLDTPDRNRPLTADEQALKTALASKLGFAPAWFDLALRAAPEFVQAYLAMGHAPDEAGALDAKTRALVYIAIYSSPALIEPTELRQHVRRAISLGATTQELLDVVQLASGIGLHAFTTGIPLLVDHIDG